MTNKLRYLRYKAINLIIFFLIATVTMSTTYPPLAGTEITNKATVTYLSLTGGLTTLDSNITRIGIIPVYIATLTDGGTQVVTTSKRDFEFSHVLTNLGNTNVDYSFSHDYPNGYTNMKWFIDIGSPGYQNETLYDFTAANKVNVPAATLGAPTGNTKIIGVKGTAPTNLVDNSVHTYSITTTYYNTTGTALGTLVPASEVIAAGELPKMLVAKSFLPGSVNTNHAADIEIKLNIENDATNANTGKATNFLLEDILDPGLEYVSGSAVWTPFRGVANLALTDGTGDVQTVPLTTLDPEIVDYSATGVGTNQTKISLNVNKINATDGSSTRGILIFKVRLKSGATAGIIGNTATFNYKDDSNVSTSGTSSTATLTVTTPPNVSTFTGDTVLLSKVGEVVVFTNTLTNSGVLAETYDLSLGNNTVGAFPSNTIIDITGNIDVTGDGIPDGETTLIGGQTTVGELIIRAGGTSGGTKINIPAIVVPGGQTLAIKVHAVFQAATLIPATLTKQVKAISNGVVYTATDTMTAVEVGKVLTLLSPETSFPGVESSIHTSSGEASVFKHKVRSNLTDISANQYRFAVSNSNSSSFTTKVYEDTNGDGNYTLGTDLELTTSGVAVNALNSYEKTIFVVTTPGANIPSGTSNIATVTMVANTPGDQSVIYQSFANNTLTVLKQSVTIEKYQSKTANGSDWTKNLIQAQPGEKVYYKIVVTNTSTGGVELPNLLITDAVPQYTKLTDGGSILGLPIGLGYALQQGILGIPVPVPVVALGGGALNEGFDGSLVTTGITLLPSDTLTLYFAVKIDNYVQ